MLASNPHGVALGLVQGYLPILDIAFIARDDDWCLGGEVSLQLLDPHIDLVPRLQVSDVVYNESPLCALIVNLVEGMISLLSGCVPDVERVLLSAGQ